MNEVIRGFFTADEFADKNFLLIHESGFIWECFLSFLSAQSTGMVVSKKTLAEALSAAQGRRYDVVFLDLELPGLNSASAVQEILSEMLDAVVVIFSDCLDLPRLIAAFKSGARGVIAKDMSLSAFIPAVNIILAGEVFLPNNIYNYMRWADASEDSPMESKEVLDVSEVKMLKMIWTGASNKLIGKNMEMSEANVKAMLRKIFAKLKVRNRTHAVSVALDSGFI